MKQIKRKGIVTLFTCLIMFLCLAKTSYSTYSTNENDYCFYEEFTDLSQWDDTGDVYVSGGVAYDNSSTLIKYNFMLNCVDVAGDWSIEFTLVGFDTGTEYALGGDSGVADTKDIEWYIKSDGDFVYYTNAWNEACASCVSQNSTIRFVIHDTTNWDLYVDDVAEATGLLFYEINDYYDDTRILIGGDNDNQLENLFIYNGTSRPNESIVEENFTVTAVDIENNAINVFNVSINRSNYIASGGTVTTGILDSDTTLYNINVSATNFYTISYYDYNVSSDLQANMTPYTEIEAYNIWNSTSINSFTVSINGTNYTTTTGTIHVPVNTTEYVSITSSSYISRNISLNLLNNQNISLWQSEFNVSVYEKSTNNTIDTYTVAAGGTNYNTTTGNLTIYADLCSFVWNISSVGYIAFPEDITIDSAYDSVNTSMYSSEVNITAFDYLGNAISVFEINITYPNGYQESGSTTTGNISFNLLNSSTYNYTFDSSGYQLITNQSFNVTSNNTQIQLSIYTENSINFTFKDEKTDTIIVEEVEVEFIGATKSYNYTISNGSGYVDLLTPENYTIRYNIPNYTTRSYYLEITNRTNTALTLYGIINTSTQITITVYDQITLNTLENSMVYLLRYFQQDNVYRTVAMYSTDTSGKAYFDVELSNEYYKFLVDYPWQTRKLETNELYIEGSTINLYIPLYDEVAENYYKQESILYSLDYNSDSGQYEVTYTDSSSVGSEYCLYLKTHEQYSKDIVNSTCSSSSSATLTVGGLTENKTYYAVFTSTIDDEENIIATGWRDASTDEMNLGGYGVFMTVIMVSILTFVGSYHIFALILGSSGLLFAKFLGLITIEWGNIIVVLISSMVLALMIKIKK
jgi:hypothetical protein